MGVLGDGIDKTCGAAGSAVVAVRPLARIPPIVATELHAIDLLPKRLSDISDPEVSRLPIEAEAPGISEAPSIDLRTSASLREWVVGRVDVGRAPVGIDAQHLAEKDVGVLPISHRI